MIDGIGIGPRSRTSKSIHIRVFINFSAFTSDIGTGDDRAGWCNCFPAIAQYHGRDGRGGVGRAGNGGVAICRNGEIVALYRVGEDPRVRVALAVGVGPSVGLRALAGWRGTYDRAYGIQHLPAVVGDHGRYGLRGIGRAGHRGSAVGGHREVFPLDGVGEDPL